MDSTDQAKTRKPTPSMFILDVHPRDNSDAPTKAHLLFERVEEYQYEKDGTLNGATFTLSYCRISKHIRLEGTQRGKFTAYYQNDGNGQSHVSLSASSGTRGYFVLEIEDLKGYRIGRFALDEVVTWVKRWPTACVNTVELYENQGHNPENKIRRNRLWEKVLDIDFTDPESKTGQSREIFVSDLRNRDTWRSNLNIIEMQDYINGLLAEQRGLENELEKSTALADVRQRAYDEAKNELDGSRKRTLASVRKAAWVAIIFAAPIGGVAGWFIRDVLL